MGVANPNFGEMEAVGGREWYLISLISKETRSRWLYYGPLLRAVPYVQRRDVHNFRMQ